MRSISVIAGAVLALAAAPALAAEDQARTVKVSLTEWELGFKEVEVDGTSARFEITNDGTVDHAFEIEGEIGGEEFEVYTPQLEPGEVITFSVELPPGSYEVYCPVEDHDEKGMAGVITFEGDD